MHSLRLLTVFEYILRIIGRLPSSPFTRPDMQVSDGENADEHGLHGAVLQRGGGEPQWAVGDTAALGQQVEHVGTLFDRLGAERKQSTTQ